jgi:ligand-binding sensor domain-containing protein
MGRIRTRILALGAGIFLLMLLVGTPSALALDPSLDISQYAHTAWKVRDGFAQGAIETVAQMPDGYLWLGTDFGLLRFDGVRAIPFQPPVGDQLTSSFIVSLIVSRDGTLPGLLPDGLVPGAMRGCISGISLGAL